MNWNWTGFLAFVISVATIAGLVILAVVVTRDKAPSTEEAWMIKGHRRKL